MHEDSVNRIEVPNMSKLKPTTLPVYLPDDSVLTESQTSELTGLSDDTLKRLHQRGEGPPRVQLSTRRHGYALRDIRRWLESKTSLGTKP